MNVTDYNKIIDVYIQKDIDKNKHYINVLNNFYLQDKNKKYKIRIDKLSANLTELETIQYNRNKCVKI
jgi:hypothetical protein